MTPRTDSNRHRTFVSTKRVSFDSLAVNQTPLRFKTGINTLNLIIFSYGTASVSDTVLNSDVKCQKFELPYLLLKTSKPPKLIARCV